MKNESKGRSQRTISFFFGILQKQDIKYKSNIIIGDLHEMKVKDIQKININIEKEKTS